MMLTTRVFTFATLLALTAACSDSSDAPSSGAIPQHQIDALERAKNTEAMLMEAEQKRRQQMVEQYH